MGDSDAFSAPGSSQQLFQHTYNLWESSTYYNINDLSARNLVVKENTEGPPCTCTKSKEKKVVFDPKNRRVISKDSLYDEHRYYHPPNPKKEQKSSEPKIDDTSQPPPNNWTAQYWRKSTQEYTATDSQRHPQPNCNYSIIRPNKIQTKLNKALSQPLKIDKAASMMAKMGWEGGALGKTGTGIVEPIAPNAEYASGIGFGQPEPKPKQPKLQKPRTVPSRSYVFRMNVLSHILDFVKNDFEVEVVFESKLANKERKRIHKIVEDIVNEEFNGEVEENNIFNDILNYNKYILRTISEGVRPYRALCLFKEAPDHLYLVTHLDLRYDPEDTEETNEQTDKMDGDSKQHTNEVKEQAKEINEVTETNGVINIDETLIENHSLNEISANDDESITKSNESLNDDDDCKSDEDCKRPFKNYKKGLKNALKFFVNGKRDSKPININRKSSKFCKVTTNTLNEETNPFLKSILSVLTDDTADLTKNDLKIQILEYFDEFAKEDMYTEFKFLGPFEGIEVEAINEFINNLWLCCIEGEELNDDVVSIMKEAKCGFAIKTDPNGSALIYKTKKEESGT